MNKGVVKIKNIDFEYIYHGKVLDREPQMTQFNIDRNDIKDYEEYKKLINSESIDDDKRTESVSFIISWLISVLLSIMSCYMIYIHNTFNIIYNTLFGIIESIILTFILYKTIYPSRLANSISRIFKSKIKQPINCSYVESFLAQKQAFMDKRRQYHNLYKYLPTDMDIITCGNKGLMHLVDFITTFYKKQNDKIRKSNNKQYQNWWKHLDPFDFENEVAHWFEEKGYDTEVTQKVVDGGVDVIIKKNDYIGYVQCKRYNTTKVDVDVVRSLQGVVSVENATQGIVVCILGITDQAKKFAEKANIRIITLNELAPQDLFHPIKHKPLLNYEFSKANNYWMRIGDLQLSTIYFQEECEAQKHINKFMDPNYHLMRFGGLYYVLYGKRELIQEIKAYLL